MAFDGHACSTRARPGRPGLSMSSDSSRASSPARGSRRRTATRRSSDRRPHREHRRAVARVDRAACPGAASTSGPSMNGRSRSPSRRSTDTGIELVRHLDDAHHRVGAASSRAAPPRASMCSARRSGDVGCSSTTASAAKPAARASSRQRAAAPAASACRPRPAPAGRMNGTSRPRPRAASAIAGIVGADASFRVTRAAGARGVGGVSEQRPASQRSRGSCAESLSSRRAPESQPSTLHQRLREHQPLLHGQRRAAPARRRCGRRRWPSPYS